jgi:hypothetical protein
MRRQQAYNDKNAQPPEEIVYLVTFCKTFKKIGEKSMDQSKATPPGQLK